MTQNKSQDTVCKSILKSEGNTEIQKQLTQRWTELINWLEQEKSIESGMTQ